MIPAVQTAHVSAEGIDWPVHPWDDDGHPMILSGNRLRRAEDVVEDIDPFDPDNAVGAPTPVIAETHGTVAQHLYPESDRTITITWPVIAWGAEGQPLIDSGDGLVRAREHMGRAGRYLGTLIADEGART
jgi:hypothetical protein